VTVLGGGGGKGCAWDGWGKRRTSLMTKNHRGQKRGEKKVWAILKRKKKGKKGILKNRKRWKRGKTLGELSLEKGVVVAEEKGGGEVRGRWLGKKEVEIVMREKGGRKES